MESYGVEWLSDQDVKSGCWIACLLALDSEGGRFITPQLLHMAQFVPLQRRLRSFYLLGGPLRYVCGRQPLERRGQAWTCSIWVPWRRKINISLCRDGMFRFALCGRERWFGGRERWFSVSRIVEKLLVVPSAIFKCAFLACLHYYQSKHTHRRQSQSAFLKNDNAPTAAE